MVLETVVVPATKYSIGLTAIPKYFHIYAAHPTIRMVPTFNFRALMLKIDHE